LPTRIAALGLAVLILPLLAAGASLFSEDATPLGSVVPDGVAYRAHTAIATTLSLVQVAPSVSASQWLRAASHADSADQLNAVATGLSNTRRRSGFSWDMDDRLCTQFADASPKVRRAITDSGLVCSGDPGIFGHVDEGSPTTYDSRPPIGGTHYPVWYRSFGLAPDVVVAGYWVHNLEHGAVVLLYKCDVACSDLEPSLRELYAGLPAVGNNERLSGGPRLLITQYNDMDHPFAMVAWGHRLELDQLDRQRMANFYARFIDRGPECRNLVCP
jgi:hypothetical protein